jgi:hypothetical protein
MTHTLSDWVKVAAYQGQDMATTFIGFCEFLEAAPIIRKGDQLPELDDNEDYKLVKWARRDV